MATDNKSHLDILGEVFGLSRLPKAVRDSLLEEIDAIVFRSVLFRVMIDLSDEDKDELHYILESAGDDFEKPFNFLKEKVENLDEIIDEELQKIKEESLDLSQQFA